MALRGLTQLETLTFSAAWQRLVSGFLRHDKETPELLAQVIDDFPAEPLGPLVKGYMLLMLARPELRRGAIEALIEGERRMAGESGAVARHYADGLKAWLAGHPKDAVRALERVIGKNPLDAMAIKIGHAIRFMLGDAEGMRRSLSRVVSLFADDVPNAGFIKGCYAFALEETGDYAGAERTGRKAVELEPADAWGRHAVAHVFEMTGRPGEGLSWLSDKRHWAHCNNFGFHMHWHIGLFQLELGRADEALMVYDESIRKQKTDDFRDVANAASLLQRIELEGTSVGNRWEELADIAERRISDRQLAFADLHYLLALLGAGRFSSAETLVTGLLDANTTAGEGSPLDATAAALGAGLLAFRSGHMADAAQLLGLARKTTQSIGGSHAQRDVFEQMYLEALVRSGMPSAGAKLADRRLMRGGRNRFAERRLGRILAPSENGAFAMHAMRSAPVLDAH